jgi:hypothetical protein
MNDQPREFGLHGVLTSFYITRCLESSYIVLYTLHECLRLISALTVIVGV